MKTPACSVLGPALILAACGQTAPSEDAINTAIAETQHAQVAATTEVAEEFRPTNTPRPSPTALPPTPPPPTVIFSTDDRWAKNYVGSAESGGVIVEIGRVLVAYKSAMPDQPFDELNQYIDGWADMDVVGELLFKITNNTATTISIYPDQGSVQIGSEQIDLTEFMFGGTFGDDLGGEIFPGVTKIGGIWFGIRRSTPADVTQLVYRCSGPVNSESFDRLGPDITITIDVPVHVWEDIPDEFK